MLNDRELCDLVNKRSHYRKKGRKGGLSKRGLRLLAPFDSTSRPAGSPIAAESTAATESPTSRRFPQPSRPSQPEEEVGVPAQSHGLRAEPSGPIYRYIGPS